MQIICTICAQILHVFTQKTVYLLYTLFKVVNMTHPKIHIKVTKPLPEEFQKAINEKKERLMMYSSGNIKAIREKDKKKDVPVSSGR